MFKIRRKKKDTANKKVLNAKTKVFKGITFKSGLEKYFYEQCLLHKIDVKYEQYKFVLANGFKFQNESIRPITYTPDFVGLTFIVETKGFLTEAAAIRIKLFKKHMVDNDFKEVFYMPRNRKVVDIVINQILKTIC